MKVSVKKIIKYLIIVGLLVGLGFLIAYIFFPTPKSIDAYNYINNISTNETYENLKTANTQIDTLLTSFAGEEEDLQLKSQFANINNIYYGMDKLNNHLCQSLLYAQNNSTYNKETTQMKKEYQNFEKIIDKINTYLTDYYSPFYNETTDKTYNSVLTYANVVSGYNFELLKSYNAILTNATNILPSLTQDFDNNELTKTKTSVSLKWSKLYQDNYKNGTLNTNNILLYKEYSNRLIDTGYTLNYFNNYQTASVVVKTVNENEISQYLLNIMTPEYTDYYDSLDETQKQVADAINTFVVSY